MKNVNKINENIYITSDEDIKDVRPHKGKWQLEKGQILNQFPDYLTDLSECKLVIMTTDPQLIADGVQAIDDEFLEWFVKNPSCEEVEVRYTVDFNSKAIIIIPKEEKDYTGLLQPVGTKQETIEEAADRYFPFAEKIGGETYTAFRGFMTGAKWQQEQDKYNDEELSIITSIRNYFRENNETSFENFAYNFLDKIIKHNK
jgi:hypothetical protein